MDGREIEVPLILHHILSFLTTEEAAQTSLLSKAWLEAWRTRSILEFDDENLFRTKKSAANLSARVRERAQKDRIKKFSRYMETTMKRYSDRKISINILKLRLDSGVIPKSVILESIRIATENNVRTLDLYLCGTVLGDIVFRGGSIVNLKLSVCGVRTLSVNQIRCSNIETLHFYLVDLDELMFENIIRGCPLLKLLRVGRVGRPGEEDYGSYDDRQEDYDYGEDEEEYYGGDKYYGTRLFRVEHGNLQRIHFQLYKYQSLKLGDLPRLETVHCTNDKNYVPNLQDVCAGDYWVPCGFSLYSTQYQNMTALELCAVGIGDDFFHNFATMFPKVEDLSIEYCQNLRIVKLWSQSIKRIRLAWNRGWKEAHFVVPNIVYFEYWSEAADIPLISFSSVGSWVSYLRVGWRFEVANLWFLKVKELLSCLVQSEISLSVSMRGRPATINLDEIRNIFVSSEPIMVEELLVYFSNKSESMSSTLAMVDGLFRICRPRILCQHLRDIFCMQLLYKILVLERNQEEIRFWQSDLKDIGVGTFKRGESRGFWNRIGQLWLTSPNVYKLLEMGDNVLDWQGFLDVSRTIIGAEGICFKFEWIGLQRKSLNG